MTTLAATRGLPNGIQIPVGLNGALVTLPGFRQAGAATAGTTAGLLNPGQSGGLGVPTTVDPASWAAFIANSANAWLLPYIAALN